MLRCCHGWEVYSASFFSHLTQPDCLVRKLRQRTEALRAGARRPFVVCRERKNPAGERGVGGLASELPGWDHTNHRVEGLLAVRGRRWGVGREGGVGSVRVRVRGDGSLSVAAMRLFGCQNPPRVDLGRVGPRWAAGWRGRRVLPQ